MDVQSLTESTVDVLIIGAGPAGLTAATWMAHLGVKTCIVDKRNDKVHLGHADGVHARTQEIFDSFGFGDRLTKEGNPCVESTFWVPDGQSGIKKMGAGPFDITGISSFKLCTLTQGRIESFYIENLRKYSGAQVERSTAPVSLEIDESVVEDVNAHPVTVILRHESVTETGSTIYTKDPARHSNTSNSFKDHKDQQALEKSKDIGHGTTKIVKAKYVIGCDGAHSWTRQQIGCQLEGDSTDYVFGVADIVPISNFPDIRTPSTIHSATHGLMYVIPRERGIVRFYVQLDEVSPDARGRVERSKITPEMIISGARKILSPYTLSYKYCEWSTAYQIGRRLGKSYHKSNRVFLAGDAVHTHSPRGGQGMNLSIHDAFNLGWKIGLCVKGITHRSILETYESERRQVAQDLIEFDRLVGDPISGQRTPSGKKIDNIDGVEPARLGMLSAAFYGGFTVNYDKSILVDKNKDVRVEVAWTKDITNKIEVGMRFPSLQVVKQADASVWRFLQLLKSDGRFRIVLFAGNIKVSSHKSRVEEFCRLLEQDCSFLKRITPAGEPIDSIIELITLHLSPRKLTSIFDFPPLLRPFDEEKGWDYDKIFVDDETYHHGHGQAYRQSGVDPQQGAVVVVRPDQHIAYVGNIEDVKSLEQYFLSVLFDKSQNLFV